MGRGCGGQTEMCHNYTGNVQYYPDKSIASELWPDKAAFYLCIYVFKFFIIYLFICVCLIPRPPTKGSVTNQKLSFSFWQYLMKTVHAYSLASHKCKQI